MTDQRPRIAIFGAGPSGLAAAHHLADTHRVWLFDSRNAIGGVWSIDADSKASHQAYDWLETNTPTALFAFHGFPLIDDDFVDHVESSNNPYVSGKAAQRYYARFADSMRLYNGGRLTSLNLCTTVLSVRRPSEEEKTKLMMKGDRWRGWLMTVKSDDGKINTLPFERLIIATGAFSSPSIPEPFQASIQKSIAFHSNQLGSPPVAARLSTAKRIIVVGGGKSSLDLVTNLMRSSSSQNIVLITSSKCGPSAWPSPHGHGASFLSRLRLFGAGHLSPWAGSRTWFENNRLGQAFRKYYWNFLARSAQRNYPPLFPSFADSPPTWRDILRSTTRLFPAPPGLKLEGQQVSVLHARVTDISVGDDQEKATMTITHTDGRLQSLSLNKVDDVVIACTGYQPHSQSIMKIFEDPKEAKRLGIPGGSDDNRGWWQILKREIQDIRRSSNILADIFDEDELIDHPIDTFRLYHHLIPIAQASSSNDNGDPHDFAIMGLPQTLSAAIVADVQARWLAQFFVIREKEEGGPEKALRLPLNEEVATRATARLVAASITRYGVSDSRQGTAMALELVWYADLLLSDIRGEAKKSQSLLHSLRALSSDDFL